MYKSLLSGFNPASAGTGIAILSVMTYASVFYIGKQAGGLLKLCHNVLADKYTMVNIQLAFYL